jgi:hypothetical protein
MKKFDSIACNHRIARNTACLMLLSFCCFSVQAEVIIDGVIGSSEYDYTLMDLGGNESGVPDDADMVSGHIAGGLSLYLGWITYATPYDLDGEDDDKTNFVRASVDLNNDGLADFRIRIEGDDTAGIVYRGAVGSGWTDIAGTFSTFTLVGQPEAAVGWDLFTLVNGGASVFSEGANTFNIRWNMDGGGDSADDSIAWQTVTINMQTVPEPTSIALIGFSAVTILAVRRYFLA